MIMRETLHLFVVLPSLAFAALLCGKASAIEPAASVTNPLLTESTLPYHLPPFAALKDEHFAPAFEQGMEDEIQEIAKIAGNPAPATFDNTISALERSGELLTRVARVFYNLTGSNTNPDIQAIEREMAPRMAKHRNTISLDAALFARVADLNDRRASLGLDDEQMRVLERTYDGFVRAGAKLDETAKEAGFWVVALDPESEENLFDSPDRVWQGDLVLVVGAEGAGLRHGIRRLADHRFAIPMQGRVGSLNVASAGALALFEAARRTRKPPHPRGEG